MKRLFVALCLSLGLVATSASALAIGGEFSFPAYNGLSRSAMLSVKFNNVAPVIGVGVSIGSTTMHIGATADWWLYHTSLGGPFWIYLGPGGYADVQTGSTGTIGLGLRLPIGLQFFVLKPLELFVEVAPQAGLTLNPIKFPVWGIQGAGGFRFWF